MPEEEDYTVYCSPSEVWEGQLSLWEEEEEEEGGLSWLRGENPKASELGLS